MKTRRVAKSGALAPVWLFWNALWRQNFFGAGRKILKNKIFPVLVLKNLGKILELEIWEKLSHKNAIKMAWWVIFNFVQMEKVSNCGAFDQNCGGFEKKIGGAFWRFLAQKGAVPDSEPLETLFKEIFH